ncbi:hypothetical protein Dimus_038939 [Dionaea muscipula]
MRAASFPPRRRAAGTGHLLRRASSWRALYASAACWWQAPCTTSTMHGRTPSMSFDVPDCPWAWTMWLVGLGPDDNSESTPGF